MEWFINNYIEVGVKTFLVTCILLIVMAVRVGTCVYTHTSVHDMIRYMMTQHTMTQRLTPPAAFLIRH